MNTSVEEEADMAKIGSTNTKTAAGKSEDSTPRQRAIEKIRELMAEHRIKTSDLAARKTGRKKIKPTELTPPSAVYRNPATGEEWNGKGAAPPWLKEQEANGFDREKFLIKKGWGMPKGFLSHSFAGRKHTLKKPSAAKKKASAKKPAAKKRAK